MKKDDAERTPVMNFDIPVAPDEESLQSVTPPVMNFDIPVAPDEEVVRQRHPFTGEWRPGADRHHVLFLNEVNRIRTETARAALRGGRYKQTY